MRTGPSVPGYDDTAGDNASADAADPPAAGPEPPAAPGPAPAATGSHVTAGKWVASTSTAHYNTSTRLHTPLHHLHTPLQTFTPHSQAHIQTHNTVGYTLRQLNFCRWFG